MNTFLSPKSHSNINPNIARSARHFLAICLTTIGLALTIGTLYGTITNHPPSISAIADQRRSDGNFATQYFRIFKPDNATTIFTVVPSTLPASSFYPTSNILVEPCDSADHTAGCPADDAHNFYYHVKFTKLGSTVTDNYAAVIITVTDSAGLVAKTSFTIQQESTNKSTKPTIAGIPNEVIPNDGTHYGPDSIVVGDLTDDSQSEDVSSFVGFTGTNQATSSFSVQTDNSTLLPTSKINILKVGQGRTYKVQANPATGATPGWAVVMITLSDDLSAQSKDFSSVHTVSTSFVLHVVNSSNAAPGIQAGTSSPPLTYYVMTLNSASPTPTPPQFKVTNPESGSNLSDVVVTAISSNAALVPNDPSHLSCSAPDASGVGSITINPLPLPSPSPGVPQTSTITLFVTDDLYTRSASTGSTPAAAQFLYVVKDQNSPGTSFSRPSGVYLLDPLSNVHASADTMTGEMHRVSWKDLEIADGDFSNIPNVIDPLIDNLPVGEDLSLNLVDEPCYLTDPTDPNHALTTWCDTSATDPSCTSCTGGRLRAVPWDPNLQARREALLGALALHLQSNGPDGIPRIKKVSIINPNLPGADTGIQDASIPLATITGYTRENLLQAVEHEITTVQDNFPGKLVQFGFFLVKDITGQYNTCDIDCTEEPDLWHWLYLGAGTYDDDKDANGFWLVSLKDKFDGIKRPRVHFFQEDLAATRFSAAPEYIPYGPAPSPTPYSFTPTSDTVPTFAASTGSTDTTPYNSSGIVFQANTPWSIPLLPDSGSAFDKVTKTLNGKPYDGMEAAHNAYLSQYLEVYQPDLDYAVASPVYWDHLKWQAGFQSWKGYGDYLRSLAPIEAPAGLTVARGGPSSNAISWQAVYGATTYFVQRSNSGGGWTAVTGCGGISGTSSTSCTDTFNLGSATNYSYRVKATNGGTNITPYAYVAVFLSEDVNDGYITYNSGNSTYQATSNNTTQPGIQAGRGTTNIEKRGFLSFVTSSLANQSLLGAKLRLKQTTNNDAFTSLGTCMVDVAKGAFSGNPALQAIFGDFAGTPTGTNVTQVPPTIDPLNPDWVEAVLNPTGVGNINTNATVDTGHTQFRIYFGGTTSNKLAGWNSADSSSTNPPTLIVQYSP